MRMEDVVMRALVTLSQEHFETIIKDRPDAEQMKETRALGTMDCMMELLANLRMLPPEQYLAAEPYIRLQAEKSNGSGKLLFTMAADMCLKMPEIVKMAEEFFDALPCESTDQPL